MKELLQYVSAKSRPSLSFALRSKILGCSIRKSHLNQSKPRPSFIDRPTARPPSLKEKDAGIGGYFLLVIPIGAFSLGVWQIYRRQWKLNLIEELENKTNHPPVPLPDNLNKLNDMEYEKVKLVGEFDHSQEMFLGPRSLMVEGNTSMAGGLISSSHNHGFNVITPFLLADKKLKILVNRGWVPKKYKDQSHRPVGQVTGPVEFTAIVRKEEKRRQFQPDNVPGSNVFSYRDIAMARRTGSAPIYVDAVETFEGGPVGNQTKVTVRNEHMNYILTWFSLSLATSYMWYRKYVKKPLARY